MLLDCVIYCAFYSILFRGGGVFFRSRCSFLRTEWRCEIPCVTAAEDVKSRCVVIKFASIIYRCVAETMQDVALVTVELYMIC